MATKPTIANAEWASNANIASGPQSGQTTKNDPGLATRQAGAVPGRGIVGRTMNWLLNQFYLWCVYVNDLHNSVDFLNKNYTFTGNHVFNGEFQVSAPLSGAEFLTQIVCDDHITTNGASKIIAAIGASGAVRARSRFDFCDSSGVVANATRTDIPVLLQEGYSDVDNTGALLYYEGGGTRVTVAAAGSQLYFVPLNRLLRPGCVLTGAKVGFGNGALAAVAPNLLVRKRVQNTASGNAPAYATQGAAVVGNTASGTDIMDTGARAHTVAAGEEWQLQIESSDVAFTINWIAVSFTEPGPGVCG